MQTLNDTIAALATPPGEGGIAIIRISGKGAFEVANHLFSGEVSHYRTHTAHFGRIEEEGKKLDEAICLVMRSPRSYTGEDTVEFQCHGGMIASKKVLDAILRLGVRAATPGEFTFRAFMNGKLDLAQAEAVQQLIAAKSDEAYSVASKQLEGTFSQKIKRFQTELTQLAAILEAWVDFPEEGLEFASQEELSADLHSIQKQMGTLLDTFEDGKKMAHGISLVIVGAPNAGKSSLLNALLDEERAIVTARPGTTRDLLHEEVTIGGILFRLIDTAGIRETEEEIEKEGIARAQKALKEADLILAVVDATEECPEFTATLPKEKTLCLFNKIDLPHTLPKLDFPVQISISAKTKEGIEKLCQTLPKVVWSRGAPPKEEVVLTSTRHKNAVHDACTALKTLQVGLAEKRSPELLTSDIRASLSALGRIIGTDITEDILSSIFSTFCVGK
ncbi:MAG: tRNA modification GTPase MnmE [Chlamydiales bacterium]|nr:tRNA modification GTPase MnmE [Chlamydiales bacterium]MCH9619646.1 tRNA modification GTPase MnmE [Chlamydiales bacterium]MCH9623252.1 tRNA modification GTPase MnmE [Chlamydiales bacterium]